MPNSPSIKLAEGSTETARYDGAGKCYPELNFRLLCSWCSQKRTGLVIKTLTEMQPSSGCNFPHKWDEVIGLHTIWRLSLFATQWCCHSPVSQILCWALLLAQSCCEIHDVGCASALPAGSGLELMELREVFCPVACFLLCCLSFPHLLAEVQQRKWRKVYCKKIWSNLELSLWKLVCTGSFLRMIMIRGDKMIFRKW